MYVNIKGRFGPINFHLMKSNYAAPLSIYDSDPFVKMLVKLPIYFMAISPCVFYGVGLLPCDLDWLAASKAHDSENSSNASDAVQSYECFLHLLHASPSSLFSVYFEFLSITVRSILLTNRFRTSGKHLFW